MPLVTSKELLQRAQAEGYAIGAFNANNMECVQAVIETAEAEQSPVILQVSQGAIAYAGLEFATTLVRTAAELATVPVVLHLDHGTDFLMFDGSSLPLDENIATTRRITEIAHACGIPVESELGKIPKVEDNLTQQQVDDLMADPKQAERFVEEAQCDSLAVAIGSVHGMKESIQPLDIERLDELKRLTGIPMVLHGASGVLCTRADAAEKGIKLAPNQGTLEDAIKHGISKVNVATELSMAYLRGMKQAFEARPNEKDMRKIMLPGKEAVKEVVRYYIRLFGSNGKAVKNGAVSGLTASEIKYHE
jgi:fructose-bisphosphate aldolase class II